MTLDMNEVKKAVEGTGEKGRQVCVDAIQIMTQAEGIITAATDMVAGLLREVTVAVGRESVTAEGIYQIPFEVRKGVKSLFFAAGAGAGLDTGRVKSRWDNITRNLPAAKLELLPAMDANSVRMRETRDAKAKAQNASREGADALADALESEHKRKRDVLKNTLTDMSKTAQKAIKEGRYRDAEAICAKMADLVEAEASITK